MSGEPPTKKARGSVEDDELPITEGTQDHDDSMAEWFEKYEEDERLEAEMFQIAVQASLANEKIEEKTKEIEPAVNPSWVLTWVDVKRDVKRKGNLTVGVAPETTVELEKVLKQVHKASSGSEDNMSLMMTGP